MIRCWRRYTFAERRYALTQARQFMIKLVQDLHAQGRGLDDAVFNAVYRKTTIHVLKLRRVSKP
jgi:hypothetical protein